MRIIDDQIGQIKQRLPGTAVTDPGFLVAADDVV